MGHFIPCQGKTACRDDSNRCLTCGRTLEEIIWLRDLLGQLADLAIEHEYENIEQYTAYLARKLGRMIASRRDGQQTSAAIN